ncbi:hypothetical protein IGI04_018444, partial [Brassica rapa subsp. trilocularis]
VFNNSPDETAYSRMLLNRENISNAAVMIQPSLTAYSFNSIPQAALLDVVSIASDQPQEDAQMIAHGLFPMPRLVVCDQHGSQASFLLAKLNPSASYNNASEMNTGSDVIFTDDASLEVFYQHLQKLAVQIMRKTATK